MVLKLLGWNRSSRAYPSRVGNFDNVRRRLSSSTIYGQTISMVRRSPLLLCGSLYAHEQAKFLPLTIEELDGLVDQVDLWECF
jgi:hypothetical protein